MNTILAALLLCLNVAACNLCGEQGFSLSKNEKQPEALTHHLDNVAREFSIKDIAHLDTVSEISGVEGEVIAIITKEQQLESVDEAIIKELVQPLVKRHVDTYFPEYTDFKITDASFELFKNGGLLLRLSVGSNRNSAIEQVYIKPEIAGNDMFNTDSSDYV